MGLISLFQKVILKKDEPEEDGFFDDLDWRKFRTDDSIWNDYPHQRPSITYVRELQLCYDQVLEELKDNYLYDVPELLQKFNEAHKEVCALERELAKVQGEKIVLEARLQSALDWQTAGGRKNEILSSRGLETEAPKEPPRESKSNQFVGKTGASKQENMMLAAAYFENNWSPDEIAEALGLSASSIKVYLSTMRKHYETKFVQGRKMIIFDEEYGSIDWDLALYEKLTDKQLERIAI